MPLTVRERLGPYEIVAQLGAVGTGKAYRARGPRLSRDAAIKAHSNPGFGFGEEKEASGWLSEFSFSSCFAGETGYHALPTALAARIGNELLKVGRNHCAPLRHDLHE